MPSSVFLILVFLFSFCMGWFFDGLLSRMKDSYSFRLNFMTIVSTINAILLSFVKYLSIQTPGMDFIRALRIGLIPGISVYIAFNLVFLVRKLKIEDTEDDKSRKIIVNFIAGMVLWIFTYIVLVNIGIYQLIPS